MNLFKNIAPLKAVRDLRGFMAARKPYELWFMVLALAITGGIWFGFLHDSQFEKPYEPNIIYVDSWPITRTDKEIIDQQMIDKKRKDALLAEVEKKEAKRRAEFKQIDDGLKKWGL